MKPKNTLRSTARLAFALPSTALALLASGSLASAQTVSLDFESETAGSTTVPTGWSYTTVGAGKTYTTSALNGGTNNSGVGTGLGGVLVSDNATFGSIIPNTFLLNSGTAVGFDTSKAITGTYDFKQSHSSAYDSSAFLFGDIKAASFPKTDAGQLLLAYHSQGGYGNSPNRLVDGTETNVGTVTGSVGGHADDVWYRATITWTPTAGTKGNFTLTTKRLSNNAAVANMTATGVTLTPAQAYLGFADLWASATTFDNISVTGTTFAGAYWDTNGTTAGAGNPATGTWDGSSNWNPSADGTGTTAAWSAGGVAIFSAGNDSIDPYTVTVSGTQDIGGLSFENGTTTLTGDALRMVSNSYAFVKPGSTATIASNITDDAGIRVLSKTGTGTLILTGDNSGASGSMSLADGITEVDAVNSILGTGKNLTIDANATLLFRSGVGAGNIPTAIDRVVASSTGTIAADNYDSTSFDFGAAGLTGPRLGAVGNVSYTGTLTPQGTTYRLGGGGGTLTMANTNALTGVGRSLVVQGNVVLAGANNYGNGTTLSSGTLTLGNAGSLGAGGLTITGGTIAANGTVATANTIAANGDFSIGGTGTLTMGGSMTLNANRIITNNNTTAATTFGAISGATRTLTISGSGNTTVSGNITTTTGTLTKNGAGVLTLGGANTYSGTTTVDGGTLVLSGSNSSAGATTINAATLHLNSNYNGGLASGTLTTSNNAAVIQAINADRAISNNMTLNSNATISGSQSLTVNGTVTINNTRTLTNNISGTGKLLTLSNITRDGANNRNLVLSGTGNTTVNGTIVLGSGTFTKSGNGTVTLNNANTYTGATAVTGGTLIARNASALGSGAAANVSVATNTGLVYNAAADTQLLIGNNLAITGGASTVIGASIGSTATSAAINVAGAGTISNAAHRINMYGVAGVAHATGLVTLIQSVSGTLNPAAVPTLGTVYNNTDFTINTTAGDGGTSAFTRTATALQVNLNSETALTAAHWTGGLSGNTNVWAASNGTTASNWVTAATGGATALVPGPDADVFISADSVVTAPTSTTLGADMSIKSLTISDTANGLGLNADGYKLTIGTGGITMAASVPTSTIGANVGLGANQTWTNNSGNSLTVSGVISGSSTLEKAGAGTLALTNTNTYTGATTVSAGTLIVNGSTAAASTVTVAAGTETGTPVATIAGSGTINGTLTLAAESDTGFQNGGVLAPGATAGDIQTLNAGTTTWNGGSVWNFDLSSSNDTSDKLNITGDFVKGTGTGFEFNFQGSTPFWSETYILAQWSGALTGFDIDASDFSYTNLGPGSYSTSSFAISGNTLTFTAIPEPSTALAGLLLTAGLLRRRRQGYDGQGRRRK